MYVYKKKYICFTNTYKFIRESPYNEECEQRYYVVFMSLFFMFLSLFSPTLSRMFMTFNSFLVPRMLINK